jgi:hypothetical protein
VVPLSNQVTTLNHKRFKGFKMFSDGHLKQEEIPGAFFPPARCILERRVLDVNKIHYILASIPDKSKIVAAIDNAVSESTSQYGLNTLSAYRQKYARADRFDTAEVVYIKRMLQVALLEELRTRITGELFARYVSTDEHAFADELYMDEDQLKVLVDAGMIVGSHGYNHDWLDSLEPTEQVRDIDRSLEFLRHIGVPSSDWAMCYPYGAWTRSILEVLRVRGCAIAFTTETELAHLSDCDPLLIPRLDTNDLPRSAMADPVRWTLSVT